ELADALCRFSSRLLVDKMDLEYVTVDPFTIEVKPGATPTEQRTYRHNPATQKKVQVEIDRFLAAGLLRRSYSN
ncbi:unnamed protein product, partial [Sphacelaria rigidula]